MSIMNPFKSKAKQNLDKIKSALSSYLNIFEYIEEHKLTAKYYDNSNVSVVKSGKLPLVSGWYLEDNKIHGVSNPPLKLYETFIDCMIGAMNEQS